MYQRTIWIFWILVFAAVCCTPIYAQGPVCTARLSGDQEAPPPGVETDGRGMVIVRFDAAFTEANVRLVVNGVPDVTAAHFHCNIPGENGPVAFGMFNPGPLPFDGRVAEGTLVNEDFVGADCVPLIGRPVNNIAALAFAMREGLIYANVHSMEFGGGEVRGQLACTPFQDRDRERNGPEDDDPEDDGPDDIE